MLAVWTHMPGADTACMLLQVTTCPVPLTGAQSLCGSGSAATPPSTTHSTG
jgi:hypothetical protein